MAATVSALPAQLAALMAQLEFRDEAETRELVAELRAVNTLIARVQELDSRILTDAGIFSARMGTTGPGHRRGTTGAGQGACGCCRRPF